MPLSRLSHLPKIKPNQQRFLRKRQSQRKSSLCRLSLPKLPCIQTIQLKPDVLLPPRKISRYKIIETFSLKLLITCIFGAKGCALFCFLAVFCFSTCKILIAKRVKQRKCKKRCARLSGCLLAVLFKSHRRVGH